MNDKAALDTVVNDILDGRLDTYDRNRLVEALNQQIRQDRAEKKMDTLMLWHADPKREFVITGTKGRRWNGTHVTITSVAKTRATCQMVGTTDSWGTVRVPLANLKPVQ